jgi:DNA-binding SARP family transcriptional activator
MHNVLASPDLRLALHGYPRAWVHGRAAPLGRKHGLALAATLSLRAQPVGRDVLAALLWPDAPAGVGRGRLRRRVHELNSALAQRLVEGDADALWLAPGWRSDVQATCAAIAAPDLRVLSTLCEPAAAGLLEGFSLDASDAFDDWLDAERRALRAALAHALERALAAAIDARDADAAEHAAQALLRLDAGAEAGHIARLQARALRGDAAGVEAAYFDGAARWREDYGSRPSARVEAAYAVARAAMRRHAPIHFEGDLR